MATALLSAAVEFAGKSGATFIEGYPLLETDHGAPSLYVGTYSMFAGAGFQEVSRVRKRPRMRLQLSAKG